MQLLTMKRGHQEDDSNGNNASDVTIPAHHDNVSSGFSPSQQLLYQHQVLPDIKPSEDVLQHTSSDHQQHLQTAQAGTSSFLQPSSLVSRQHQGSLSRPEQLFPSADTPVSPEECSDSFCHLASSTVDSDSSSSPDINSNTLLVGFGEGDLRRREAGSPTVPRISDAPSPQVQKNVSGSRMRGEKMTEEEIFSQPVTTARGEDQPHQQEGVSLAFHPPIPPEDISPASHDVPPEKMGGNFSGPAKQESSWERVQSHSALGREEMCSAGHLSQSGATGLTGSPSGKTTTLSSDVCLRQSVDMDVDSEYAGDPPWLVSAAEGIPSSCVPFPLLQAGPVGKGHPATGQSSGSLSPYQQSFDALVSHSQRSVSQPSAMEASLSQGDCLNTNMQLISPQDDSLSPQTFYEQGSTVSPDRLSSTVNPQDGTHFSAETVSWTCYSSSNVLLGNGSQDGSQVTTLRSRQSQQSSQTSHINQNGQPVDPRSVGNLGGGEGSVEEELCVYVHHLVSWDGEIPLSGDRQELPDPVATLLTEGDHTHFIPIEEECTHNHPATGTPDSADPASNTPG